MRDTSLCRNDGMGGVMATVRDVVAGCPHVIDHMDAFGSTSPVPPVGVLGLDVDTVVGGMCAELIRDADAMLARMVDLDDDERHAMVYMVARQCDVWLYG